MYTKNDRKTWENSLFLTVWPNQNNNNNISYLVAVTQSTCFKTRVVTKKKNERLTIKMDRRAEYSISIQIRMCRNNNNFTGLRIFTTVVTLKRHLFFEKKKTAKLGQCCLAAAVAARRQRLPCIIIVILTSFVLLHVIIYYIRTIRIMCNIIIHTCV